MSENESELEKVKYNSQVGESKSIPSGYRPVGTGTTLIIGKSYSQQEIDDATALPFCRYNEPIRQRVGFKLEWLPARYTFYSEIERIPED